jgi:O-antigen/teichoic acid export membrane protein
MAQLKLPTETAEMTRETRKFRAQMGHISRHSGVFFAGTLFTAAAGYLFKIYLARMLGAEALGIFALGMTMVGFLGVFNALGLPQSAVRFVALYKATGKSDALRSFMAHAIGLLLGANLILGLLMLIGGPWVAQHLYHTQSLTSYLPMFVLLMLFGALIGFFGQVLQGYREVSRRTVITNFIGTPLTMLLSVLLIRAGLGLRGYIAAQVISGMTVLVLLTLVVWRLTPSAARHFSGLPSKLEPQVVFFGAAVFGVGLLEFLLGQIDKVLIGAYINAREVGIYSVAMAIVAFVPVALQSVNQIFSPTIADLHTRGEQELLARLFQTLTKWVLGLTLPLAAVVMVFAKPLMQMFGRDFEAGWVVLVIGTLGQLINCAVGSVGYMLLMSGNQKRLVKIQAVMAVVVVVLNLALIPQWGIMGAAIAGAATSALSNIWYLREVRKALNMSPYNRSYVRLIPATACAIAMVFLLKLALRSITPAWIGIGCAIVACYVTLIGVGVALGLGSDDRLVAGAIWARLRGSFSKVTVNAG